MSDRFFYNDMTFTREELATELEQETASLDPSQWLNGEFEFDEWLSDSLISGDVKKVSSDL